MKASQLTMVGRQMIRDKYKKHVEELFGKNNKKSIWRKSKISLAPSAETK